MIYLSHLLPDEEMAELIQKYGLGMEAIEFSIGYCLDDLEKSICEYQKRLEKMNAPALSLHGPFLDLNPSSNDTRIRRVTRERFAQAYEVAKLFGAKKLIYHSCFVPCVNFLEGWVELMVPFWKEFLADKDDSVKIYMENVFDPTYTELRAVIDEVAHPAFSLCLDLGHANQASKLPLTEWVEQLGSRIGHVHVHDNDGIKDSHRALGDGTVPVEEVLTALQQHCPDAEYTIENCTKADVEKTLKYRKHLLGEYEKEQRSHRNL